MTRRLDRVNVLLREEISHIITLEMRDPRLSSVVSITQVNTSVDLRHAKIFISVLGDAEAKKRSLEALNSAASFLRRGLRHKVHLRNIPELQFVGDDSIEKGQRLSRLIREAIPDPDGQSH